MLLDTSGLLAFFDRGAKQHQDTVTYFHAASHRLLHSYIIVEFIPVATVRGHPRAFALAFVEKLQQNPLVEVVYVDEPLHRCNRDIVQRLDIHQGGFNDRSLSG